mgnify:CR=1 FL=1
MAKKNKPSKNKRSNRKILDAFQIAERAENRSGDDSDDYDGDDLHEVRDGIMDASRLLKGTGDEDGDEDDFDDEEIDSDEALGSDDDYDVLNSKFSQTIRDKAKRDKRRQKGEDIESSDEEEGYASVDESKFVSLSEAWDMDDKDLQKYEKKSSANEVVLDDNWNTESSESESESDEESENDDESDVFEQFDDEDDVDLTKTISGLKSSLKKPEKIKKRLVTETTEENEFGVPGGSGGLSINDMMAAVDSSVAKDAILIDQDEEKSKVLPTPLPKRIQQRHDRKVAYEITKEEVSKWEDAVQQNRRAEVLKFPLNPTVTHNDSATTFKSDNVPSTELEQKIHNVLEQSSLLDDKKEKTFEEIAVAKMSAEEMKKRTNELRLMRELMFRDEKRAKRIKKIKSKQYRKIQKKERLKNQEMVEGSDAESDVEDHDLKRAKERMTLKHKTQGQWAKSMIKSGLSKDASNRAELEEMLRQGEKLRTKQLGYEDGDQSDDAISDIENEYDRDDEEADNQLKNNLGKGVLAMDFMKNADEKRKQENAKELELLRKLEAGEDLDQFNDSESAVNITKNQGRRVYTPNAAVANGEIQKVNDEIMKEVQDDESSNLYNKMSKKFVDTKAKAVEDKVTKEPVTSTSNSDAEGDEESNPWLTALKEPTQKSNKIAVVDKESSKLSKAAAKIAKSRKRKSGQAVEESLIDVEETLKVTLDDDTEGNTFVQKDLIKEAFAGDDVVTEFEIEKKQVAREEDDKEEDLTLPGWGDWAGGNKKYKKRKVVRKIDGVVQKDKRKDKNLKNVIINEKVNKKNLKYQSSAVPFPFESREQYERSLRMPVGQEWTSRETHQKLTMPRVITKQGTVIDPLKAPFK